MGSDAPDTIRLTSTTYTYQITDAPEVEQMMGNGRRRIIPDEMRITEHSERTGYLALEGRSVLRDGSLASRRQVGWCIGGRWDESRYAPLWAMRVAAHIIGVPIPEEG